MNGQNPIVTSLHYSDLFHGLLVNYTDGAFLGTEFTLPALLLTPCVASFIVRSAYKISSLSVPHFCTPPKGSFFRKHTIGCKGLEGSLICISVISQDLSTNKWSLIIMEGGPLYHSG